VSNATKAGLLGLLAAFLLVLSYAGFAWRQAALHERPLLPVAFEHIDHNTEPCAVCHHNFVDDTGGGACYNCHKLTPELVPEMEGMFHDFCRGCHVEKRAHGGDSGPLRQCSLCHH
tara:strand:- start:90768 stop:91115 length:348 start_codon:yes stop_codon:yes gene_type:complete